MYIDDNLVLKKELTVSENVPGNEGKSRFKKEWNIWWCDYDEDIKINIEKGPTGLDSKIQGLIGLR